MGNQQATPRFATRIGCDDRFVSIVDLIQGRALRGHTQPTLPVISAGEEMVQATTLPEEGLVKASVVS